MAEALRKTAPAETPLYREAPNNIEAEQALLGAILVNNDAYYRISDFLKPGHFYEPLHRKIFEVAGELIRMGKMANPVTIKTFLPADGKVGDLTVPHYLARIAAEAVTVINAADYGRAIYDLATLASTEATRLIDRKADQLLYAHASPWIERHPRSSGGLVLTPPALHVQKPAAFTSDWPPSPQSTAKHCGSPLCTPPNEEKHARMPLAMGGGASGLGSTAPG